MPKIAVVGSGISGLGAAYLLQKKYEVVLYEANNYLGGHTHTHDISVAGKDYRVDTGFIVFNPDHYPNLVRLFAELGVESQPTNMGFGVKNERSGLEYNATTINQLFAQRSNFFRPRFWRLIADLKRFYQMPHPLLAIEGPGPTIGAFLDQSGYSEIFADDHLIPIASALWSSPGKAIREFPAKYLAQFMANHHMLNTDRVRPPWRVVKGGSNQYVRAIEKRLSTPPRLSCPVQKVQRFDDHVIVHSNGATERFDHVVFACHSDQVLQMLEQPSAAEQAVLGDLQFQTNHITLHTDTTIMPKAKLAWAAWNAHLGESSSSAERGRTRSESSSSAERGRTEPDAQKCTVTYWMNLLQSIDAPVDFLVSLNCQARIDPAKVLKQIVYQHPVYSHRTVAAQAARSAINGYQRSYFCGAYWGFGFHEDGLRSAVEAAAMLGINW